MVESFVELAREGVLGGAVFAEGDRKVDIGQREEFELEGGGERVVELEVDVD